MPRSEHDMEKFARYRGARIERGVQLGVTAGGVWNEKNIPLTSKRSD